MSDYERIAKAIDYIVQRADEQPALDEIAAHVHLSPFHFQRLFSRWAGVTPKRFLQVLTVERAKRLLRESRTLLEVSYAVGLSSGSRLYDHFVQLEAVTPGEFKTGGRGIEIGYALGETPFGRAFIATTARGVCSLEFLDGSDPVTPLENLRRKWPGAVLKENQYRPGSILERLFGGKPIGAGPLSLHVGGTNFQTMVWKALLRIPPGKVVSYAQVADAVGRPGAARAVGQAVGGNPVAFLIPCHRVIQQSGRLGGYHWGETRKHAIHAWETATYGECSPWSPHGVES
ncbi:bifunctional transcriptional activator/DNA repair enzyme AdaA [Methylomagnum ishizawai]|uniref:bifunctional transcriptional activator/DNA repair enzyme AdaA n=1 Tax=Methylomagnum ishizawai TaxID=1760988 RepID=UPI001C32F7E6|nr:methylated-DNA--[protein]-cysteine S-methyltransferase [Methylomagnum ishizawai]BBL75864.1 methylated-DNA--protein-cysteine methyltransferase [Methylomagnum ishizawai]